MKFSPAALQQYLPPVSSGVWWIGLSGGLDSCVLLHSLAALNLPVKLHALHVNHQISPNANHWQQHCSEICAALNIAFTAINVDVKNTGRGLEDAARAARYAVFEQHIKTGDFLFTAHHADDQAETLLLRLMRGTGPRGLAAIAATRPLANGQLYRPLLHFTRDELELYATGEGLSWVNDESNSNDHYDRNFLRNQVMPLLRERWPQFAQKWQQTAELCATSESLIDELAAQDFAQAAFQQELIGTSILLEFIEGLPVARRHNVLRHWLRGQGFGVPEQQHLTQIEQQIIAARQDAETQVNWGDLSLRVYRDRLYALPVKDLADPSLTHPIAILLEPRQVALPYGGYLNLEMSETQDKKLLKPDLPDISIRVRQGGERCRPAGRAHSQTLKRLLQDYGVAPWLRDRLPLIYSGDDLVAVADIWICEGYQAETKGYWLKYNPKTE